MSANDKNGNPRGFGKASIVSLVTLALSLLGSAASPEVAGFFGKALEDYGLPGAALAGAAITILFFMNQNQKLQAKILEQFAAREADLKADNARRDREWDERYRAMVQKAVETEAKLDAAREQLDKAEAELEKTRHSQNELRIILDAQETHINVLKDKQAEAQERYNQLADDNQAFRQANETLRAKLDNARAEIDALRETNEMLAAENARIGELEKKVQCLQNEVARLTGELENKRIEIEHLTARLDEMNAAKRENAA